MKLKESDGKESGRRSDGTALQPAVPRLVVAFYNKCWRAQQTKRLSVAQVRPGRSKQSGVHGKMKETVQEGLKVQQKHPGSLTLAHARSSESEEKEVRLGENHLWTVAPSRCSVVPLSA